MHFTLVVQVISGIHSCTVLADLKMQMETGGMSRTANLTKCLSLADTLTNGNTDGLHMCIHRGISITVGYKDVISVTIAAAVSALGIVMAASGGYANDCTRSGCYDGRTRILGNVIALVPSAPA